MTKVIVLPETVYWEGSTVLVLVVVVPALVVLVVVTLRVTLVGSSGIWLSAIVSMLPPLAKVYLSDTVEANVRVALSGPN